MSFFPSLFQITNTDWYFIPTTYSLLNHNNERIRHAPPFGPIPNDLLPASSMRVFSSAQHCELPNPNHSPELAALERAAMAGLFFATTGTISGALGSLALVALFFAHNQRVITYSYRASSPPDSFSMNFPGPVSGYCIGETLKEQSYFYYAESVNFEDIYQNSSLNRVYIHHGNVLDFHDVSETRSKIFIGSNNWSFKHQSYDVSDLSVRVFKKDGDSILHRVLEIDELYNLVIEKPADARDDPQTGDFFQLNNVLCVENPYLLTGKWLGSEEERGRDSHFRIQFPRSGYNLYSTSENSFYEEGEFTGAYVLKNGDDVSIHSTESSMSYNVVLGSSEEGINWNWIPFEGAMTNREILSYYPDWETRARFLDHFTFDSSIEDEEEEMEDPEEELVGVESIQRGTLELVHDYLDLNPEYIRLEISIFGNGVRSNWHSPILRRCWLVQDQYPFRIVGQPDGGTIDVSLKSEFGDKNLDIHKSFSIFNQYGWMINEHKMAAEGQQQGPATEDIMTPVDSSQILEGDGNITFDLFCNQTTMAHLTREYEPEYLGTNSFFKRFFTEKEHLSREPLKFYSPREKWILVNEDRTKTIPYDSEANIFEWVDPEGIEGFVENGKINLSFKTQDNLEELEEDEIGIDDVNEPDKWSVILGSRSFGGDAYRYLEGMISRRYDETPNRYRSSSFNKSDFVLGTANEPNLCVSGEIYSPQFDLSIPSNSCLGVCDNRYWGWQMRENSAPVFHNTGVFFVSAPLADLCVDFLFNEETREEFILYTDGATNKMTLARGGDSFRIHSVKQEIAIGPFRRIEPTQDGRLNDNYERVNGVFASGDNVGVNYVSSFFDNNESKSFGIMVSGLGIKDNNYHRSRGFSITNPAPFDFYDSFPIYKSFMRKSSSPRFFPVATSTKKNSSIHLGDGNSINSILYINDNQTIRSTLPFNIHKHIDGEVYIVYGQNVGPFTLNGQTYNDAGNNTDWENSSNAVFVIASADNGATWGTPHGHGDWDSTPNFQYPVMVLNSCDYLDSIYNRNTNTIDIFARCYDENGNSFLGYMAVNVLSLQEDVSLARDSEFVEGEEHKYQLSFNYRPLRLAQGFMNNTSLNHTKTENILIEESSDLSGTRMDKFVRVLGSEETHSQAVTEMGMGTTFQAEKLISGRIVGFFHDTLGVRMIFSEDNGDSWNLVETILARGGICPVYGHTIGIYYISENEIKFKRFGQKTLEFLITYGAGDNEHCKELIQREFDEKDELPIGSSKIGEQKISLGQGGRGRKWKIIYYNGSALESKESDDGSNWIFSDNF